MPSVLLDRFSSLRRHSNESYSLSQGPKNRQHSGVPSLSSSASSNSQPSTLLLTPQSTFTDLNAVDDIGQVKSATTWTHRLSNLPRRAMTSFSAFSFGSREFSSKDLTGTIPLTTEPESIEQQLSTDAETPRDLLTPLRLVRKRVQAGTSELEYRVACKRANWRCKRQISRIDAEERKKERTERKVASGHISPKRSVATRKRAEAERLRRRKKKWGLFAWLLNYPEIADFYLDEKPERKLGIPHLGNFFDEPVTPHPLKQLGHPQ